MLESLLHADLPTLITTVGYVGLAVIILCETGLLFGFFLPGDSLLFTAGLLASQGVFAIWLLIPLLAAAAIVGDSMGYAIGARIGPALYKREDSFFFRKRYIEETEAFYAKHGPYTIVLARFVPIVRTFAPTLAGVGRMPYTLFVRYNVLGGLLWTVGLTLAGYFLGTLVPGVADYLDAIIIGIILLSLTPLLHRWWQSRRT
jgi:membrane-associated protein